MRRATSARLPRHASDSASDLFNPEVGPGVDRALADAGIPEPLAGYARADHATRQQICDQWPKPEADASLNSPVVSDIPALVTGGAFDPITPPSYGSTAAATLSNALEVEFANSGHGAIAESDCSRELLFGFLADPQGAVASLDVTCAAAIDATFVASEEEFFGLVAPQRVQAMVSRLLSQP